MIYLIKQNLDMYVYCVTEPNQETEFYFEEYEVAPDGMPIFDLSVTGLELSLPDI